MLGEVSKQIGLIFTTKIWKSGSYKGPRSPNTIIDVKTKIFEIKLFFYQDILENDELKQDFFRN